MDNLALTAEESGLLPIEDDVLFDLPMAEAIEAMTALGPQVETVVPQVPAMGQSGDYFLFPAPLLEPPDPEAKKSRGFSRWRDAGVATAQLQIRGGTHYEWSQSHPLPSRSWDVGTALSEHYALAWFDRWLKQPSEIGFVDADARLLADKAMRPEMSVYYRNARAFRDRTGVLQFCEDIRAGCPAAVAAPVSATIPPAASAPAARDGILPITVTGGRSLPATGPAAAAPLAATVPIDAGLALRRRACGASRRLHGA